MAEGDGTGVDYKMTIAVRLRGRPRVMTRVGIRIDWAKQALRCRRKDPHQTMLRDRAGVRTAPPRAA